MDRFIGLIGIGVLLAIAFACSNNRSRINWRTVVVGLALQIFIGILLIKLEWTAAPFRWLTDKIAFFLSLSDQGAAFVFGDLGNVEKFGFVFAVKVIPTIIFFSAFISVMYYLGVVQAVIVGIAKVMQFLMKTSGAETLSCSANIFVGQTEAPLLVKPFLKEMTFSEMNAVMVGGFATVAGGVLAAYIGMGVSAHHLIVASVMAAPGALMMSKIFVPETEASATAGDAKMPPIHSGDNILDAAARGTTDGLNLAINVAAMLIAFISLIAVINWMLSGLDYYIDGQWLKGAEIGVAPAVEYAGYVPGSLKTILSTVFLPLAWSMGVPWDEAREVGNLIGVKICVNEFVAYAQLADLIKAGELSEKSRAIATFALCGFANFSSIGIQLGGIGALAPERRGDLARLGLRAMAAGAMVSFITGSIAGILIGNPEKPETAPPPAPQAKVSVVADASQAETPRFVLAESLGR